MGYRNALGALEPRALWLGLEGPDRAAMLHRLLFLTVFLGERRLHLLDGGVKLIRVVASLDHLFGAAAVAGATVPPAG